MTTPTATEHKLTLMGTTYTLAFDFQAIADAEEITGRSLITGLRQKDIDAPAVKLVQAMFYAVTRKHHEGLTYERVKALVTPKTLVPIWAAVLQVWIAGLAEPDEGDPAGEAQGES
jgi:hypothetical protein